MFVWKKVGYCVKNGKTCTTIILFNDWMNLKYVYNNSVYCTYQVQGTDGDNRQNQLQNDHKQKQTHTSI